MRLEVRILEREEKREREREREREKREQKKEKKKIGGIRHIKIQYSSLVYTQRYKRNPDVPSK